MNALSKGANGLVVRERSFNGVGDGANHDQHGVDGGPRAVSTGAAFLPSLSIAVD